MASRQFDVQLIPDFSGMATDIPIMEWLALQNNQVLTLWLKGN